MASRMWQNMKSSSPYHSTFASFLRNIISTQKCKPPSPKSCKAKSSFARPTRHVRVSNSSCAGDHFVFREMGPCRRIQHPALKPVLRTKPCHLIMLYLCIFELALSPPTPSLSLFPKHFQNRKVSSPAPVTTVCPSGLIAR